jgi:LysR family transcriptional activator of nhaA
MYKINFNHLHYFLTIAKEGSIVKASKVLHITQPALSHQLRLLEEDLDCKLFDRVGKRLVLNKDGQHVKEYATQIFRQSEEMISFLKTSQYHHIKIVKVGIVSWLSRDHILEVIKPLLHNPHIKVQVIQKDMVSLIKELQSKSIDLLLCDTPYTGRSKKLIGHLLTKDKIICVASSKPKGTFPKSLQQKKIVSYSEPCFLGDAVEYFLQSNRIETQLAGEFTDASLIRIACEKSGLIGFLPQTTVRESLKEKKLVKLGELKDNDYQLWAITQKEYRHNSLLFNLIQSFKKGQTNAKK